MNKVDPHRKPNRARELAAAHCGSNSNIGDAEAAAALNSQATLVVPKTRKRSVAQGDAEAAAATLDSQAT